MISRLRAVTAAAAFAFIATAVPATAQDPTPIPVVPVARIISPIPKQEVRGSAVILGSAVAPSFSRYEIAYAASAQDPIWITIGGADKPVPNGTLLMWNTRPLPDGVYILRLVVFTANGEVYSSIVTDLNLKNQAAAAIQAAEAAAVTTTQRTGTLTEFDTARSALTTLSDTVAQLPIAVMRGVRMAAYALAGLIAYTLLKQGLLLLIARLTHRPVDYGS